MDFKYNTHMKPRKLEKEHFTNRFLLTAHSHGMDRWMWMRKKATRARTELSSIHWSWNWIENRAEFLFFVAQTIVFRSLHVSTFHHSKLSTVIHAHVEPIDCEWWDCFFQFSSLCDDSLVKNYHRRVIVVIKSCQVYLRNYVSWKWIEWISDDVTTRWK